MAKNIFRCKVVFQYLNFYSARIVLYFLKKLHFLFTLNEKCGDVLLEL